MVRFVELFETDFEFIKELYDYYILNSTATYYTERITIDELKSFIPVGHGKYKSFIIWDENKPCGFCFGAGSNHCHFPVKTTVG